MAPPMEDAKQHFLLEHGTSYGYNGWLDQNWWQEVGQRLGPDVHYLDMTGKHDVLLLNTLLRRVRCT